MTDLELALLNEFLESRLGIVFPEKKREILESRLAPRLRAHGMSRYLEYCDLLQADGAGELAALSCAVTNNESYFFREVYQFDAFFGPALADLKAGSATPGVLRVLCAGCSNGEEPYTLSIMGKEHQYRMWDCALQVDAIDIDETCLATARAAEYGTASLRSVTAEQRARYFNQVNGTERWQLKPVFRVGVTCQRGNIVEVETYRKPLRYDVVFCRNVLIYFSEPALRRAVENFSQVLRPGGLLFLGHSESILGLGGAFEPVRLDSFIAYRRTGARRTRP